MRIEKGGMRDILKWGEMVRTHHLPSVVYAYCMHCGSTCHGGLQGCRASTHLPTHEERMTRYLTARIIVTLLGIAVWGYGQHYALSNVRVAGMLIMGVALAMRFAPKRWFDEEDA